MDLDQHVTFELEAIDRPYLNAYVPTLQTGGGFAYFLKTQLGVRVPSTVMIAARRLVHAVLARQRLDCRRQLAHGEALKLNLPAGVIDIDSD